MKNSWENYWRRVVTRRQNGVIATLLRTLLLPFSYAYGWGVALRNRFFQTGWLRTYTPPIPLVMSVGNIAVGGTGKTPFTLLLADEFKRGNTLGILYRGYKSKAESLSTPLALSRGKGPMFPAAYGGDEAFLLAKNFPEAHVFVGRDRMAAARLAAESGVNLIIMDDGMQHRRLRRDLDIVLLDSEDPLGQGYFLPRGLLREEVKSLKRADLVVLYPIRNRNKFAEVREKITPLTSAPVIGTAPSVAAVRTLQGDDIGTIIGKRVGLFCGIAQPDRFRQTIEDQGAIVVNTLALSDHIAPPMEQLKAYAQKVADQGGEALICTEKDKVKLPEGLDLPLPVFWVELKLEVVDGKEVWESFLDRAWTLLGRGG